MDCPAGTYSVETSQPHDPTWNGTLTFDRNGDGEFTPTGGTASEVKVQCGTDPITNEPWISFLYKAVTPARHYKRAPKIPNSNPAKYRGDVSDNREPETSDTWTAEATTVGEPGPQGYGRQSS